MITALLGSFLRNIIEVMIEGKSGWRRPRRSYWAQIKDKDDIGSLQELKVGCG